jgi:cell wall-associated NlpC family hydrolase
MPLIQANRDAVDDRFSVLGFTVRTESPLFEVAVATDPSLFRAENRNRRARANFYSSRGQGVIRARRGEAVYLLPPEVLGNFVGQPRLYFGLATYRESSRGAPDFVQAPHDGSMYVGIGQLTERGLRRSAQSHAESPYSTGPGPDVSLEWGGDAQAAARSAVSSAVSQVPTSNGRIAATPVAVAVASAYDDGFGEFPQPQELAPWAQEQAVPLDPGVGGRSVGEQALQVGDVLVSTTRQFVSRVIRLGTFSPVSHVMLYAGAGKVIESVGHGVREVALAEAISDAILAVAYRVPGLDAAGAARVVAYARSRIGQPYNFAGVAYQGFRILNPLPAAVISAIGNRLNVEVGQAGAVYCSELVLESFEHGGVLLGSRPAQSTPDGVVQLARSRWTYVGHLKAQDVPMGIQLEAATFQEKAHSVTLQAAPPARISVQRRQPPRATSLPAARLLSTAETVVVAGALAVLNPALGAMFLALRTLPSVHPVSVGVGPLFSAGVFSGAGIGWGLIFTSDGHIGVYGHIDVTVGIMAGFSAEVLVTIVEGGIEGFGGVHYGSVLSVEIHPLSFSAEVLFDEDKKFKGVAFGMGVGESYLAAQMYTVIHHSAARALALCLEEPAAPQLVRIGQTAPAHLPSPPPEVIEQPTQEIAPIAKAQVGPAVVAIGEVVAGAVFTRLLDNSGDVSWELDQMSGLKHPNDVVPNPVPAFADGPVIRLVDWPSMGLVDSIKAGFEIRWQYNGQSLGNVQISNTSSNDALGMGLTVKARIMNDSIVYPRSAPQFAALRVRIDYRFTQSVGPDHLAFYEVHLFGNGAHNQQGDWTQHSFF